ncbi:MAG: signal peptide peptidase SppA [Deltaproteobacteria bacterium]|nr:signal peptide peptidase SppA [Deltaproteobacteria bacterium]
MNFNSTHLNVFSSGLFSRKIFLRLFFVLLLSFIASLFSGCINLNMVARTQPLVENVISGDADAKILVIDISGFIKNQKKKSFFDRQEGVLMTARIREELKVASEDEDIKAIILRIDTPGGEVATTDIIHREITQFKKKKNIPVVAMLMGLATSGGYYIAVSADTIIAMPTTITGSVGVIVFKVDASGFMKKLGLVNESIKSGELKDIGSPLRGQTQKELEIMQSLVDSLFLRFFELVKNARTIKDADLKLVKDGRVFTSKQALDIGLVDSVGYFEEAVSAAKDAAGIKDAKLITYSRQGVYKNNFYSALPEVKLFNEFNLLNIDASLGNAHAPSFMYLWSP